MLMVTTWTSKVCHLLHMCHVYVNKNRNKLLEFLLGAFAKLRKAIIKFVISVRLSVRMVKLDSHWMDLDEISYLIIFRKCGEKIQVSLKSDKNNGYFIRRLLHIYDHISPNYS